MNPISSPRSWRLRSLLCALTLAFGVGALVPAEAEAAHDKKTHAKSAPAKSSGKGTSSKKSPHASSHKSGRSSSTHHPSAHSSAHASSRKATGKGKVCHETVKRKGKSVKVKVPCEPAETVVSQSPINARSLERSGTPLEGSPVKARSAPIRAYAVDGATFFHNGRKIVVEGLGPEASAGLTHEHSAQRLQRLLDGGVLTIDPVSADDSGALRARVRVDGRDVADLMRAQP